MTTGEEKFRIINAEVREEYVRIKDYFEGTLPVVWFETEEHGWVKRAMNNLSPSDCSKYTAEKEAKAAIGRLLTFGNDGTKTTAFLEPHARVVISAKLLQKTAERRTKASGGVLIARAAGWRTIAWLGRENDLELSGAENHSDDLERFEIIYAETDEIRGRVEKILEEYLKG
jgi:hypothetical protein